MGANFGRDRRRKAGRPGNQQDLRPRVLIVCEGENTEPQYFEQFARFHRYSAVRIEVARVHGKPLPLVREATDRKKDAASTASRRRGGDVLKYESVWCVFDVDEHDHVEEAKSLARRNGIHLAISNPCFELWLLLHLTDSPGELHGHDAQARLKKHVPGYDKSVDFEVYRTGYKDAVRRALGLDRLAEDIGEPGKNPTTGVYKLTEAVIPNDNVRKAPDPTDP